ncbi:MAG: DUF4276 family protein [Planctomycetes bacterium]|nr:DUF4276 family protein [Planctomycetota bacterium]
MSSVEVYIVAEGQTEQTFARDVLAPIMSHQEIYLHPALIGKPGRKGGDIRFDRALMDIGNFLRQRSDTYISTMFDYFRIHPAWPGRAEVQRQITDGIRLTPEQKAETLETATLKAVIEAYPDFNVRERFIPYIEMHEFEALLFSDADILAQRADIDLDTIQEILEQHGEPEAINDNPTQAPSKQLIALNNRYRKVVMGKVIAESIGIPAIRKKCSHFNQWLFRLEKLTTSNDQ